MNKSKIEWTDYTINPVKGLCPMACPYCYARAMYKRFKWDSEIRFDCTTLNWKPPAHSKVFIGSTIELFGDWIKPEWMGYIAQWMKASPLTTFIFLTKQPQNLIKFSPFPDNSYVGVSVTDMPMLNTAINTLPFIKAKIKYLSFEPLLSWECPNSELSFVFEDSGISWVIIGAQTKPYKPPKLEWVQEIVQACDKAGIPVFLKDNLKPLLKNEQGWTPALYVGAREPDGSNEYLRQEMPNL